MTAAAVVAAVIAAGCAFGDPPARRGGHPAQAAVAERRAEPAPTRASLSVAATVIAKNLAVPWAIAFLPDGGALVTERDTRRILKVGPERTPTA